MDLLLIGGAAALIMLLFSGKAKPKIEPVEPAPQDPEPDVPVVVVPDKPPGSSPTVAVTRGGIWPGFDGYVKVDSGDTLIKIAQAAQKLEGPVIPWRSIRDDPENAWIKEQTPTSHLELYGLELVQCYGVTVGVDCEVVAGWRARLYSTNTGCFPIIRVRQ